jgi:hypothetical protein
MKMLCKNKLRVTRKQFILAESGKWTVGPNCVHKNIYCWGKCDMLIYCEIILLKLQYSYCFEF